MNYFRDANRALIINLGYKNEKFNQCNNNVYFQISKELASDLWKDDSQINWGPVGDDQLNEFMKIHIDNGFVIRKGDSFKLNWSLGCLSSSDTAQYYWTGTKVSSFDLAYDIGTTTVPMDIYFPNYPINYLSDAIGYVFRISLELEKQVIDNAVYGIPPLQFKNPITDKIVYSWFEHDSKKYWVIGLNGNSHHKTGDQLMNDFKKDYHNYTTYVYHNPYELIDNTILIFKDTGY